MFRNDLSSDKEQNIICPITQEVMKDPVIASDGITYERCAIEEWLNKSDRSPFGVVLENKILISNYTLKNCIQDYQKQLNTESDLVSRLKKVEQDFQEADERLKKINEESTKVKEEHKKMEQQLLNIKQNTSCFEEYSNLNEKEKLTLTNKTEKLKTEWDKNNDKEKYELLQSLDLVENSYFFLKLNFRQELSHLTQTQRHALKNKQGIHLSTEEFWNQNPSFHLELMKEHNRTKKDSLIHSSDIEGNLHPKKSKCIIF